MLILFIYTQFSVLEVNEDTRERKKIINKLAIELKRFYK